MFASGFEMIVSVTRSLARGDGDAASGASLWVDDGTMSVRSRPRDTVATPPDSTATCRRRGGSLVAPSRSSITQRSLFARSASCAMVSVRDDISKTIPLSSQRIARMPLSVTM